MSHKKDINDHISSTSIQEELWDPLTTRNILTLYNFMSEIYDECYDYCEENLYKLDSNAVARCFFSCIPTLKVTNY